MIDTPFSVGAFDGGTSWRHLPLLFAWLAGYFEFFAAGLWLRSRGKPRYWPSVRAYGSLFAALNAVDGTLIGSSMDKHRREQFLKCLHTVDKEVPKSVAVHMILDNCSTHKHKNVKACSPRNLGSK